MDTNALWSAFWETGAPEFYLLYSKARKLEENHVRDNKGFGTEGYQL